MSQPQGDVDSKRDMQIQELVDQLASNDPGERLKARSKLIAMGEVAVDQIVEAFGSDQQPLRWEAANCLRKIGSPQAIPALIVEIEEADADVGWLAAEGLVAIGEKSLIPVLASLTSTHHKEIGQYYQNARHIIRTFACNEKYHLILQQLLLAFDKSEPQIGVPRAAFEAMQQLESNS